MTAILGVLFGLLLTLLLFGITLVVLATLQALDELSPEERKRLQAERRAYDAGQKIRKKKLDAEVQALLRERK